MNPVETDRSRVGGKAAALAVAHESGLPVPQWVVVTPDEDPVSGNVRERIARLGPGPFAVRSSGVAEDGGAHSFAGQFDSFLRVPAEDVGRRILDVRASGLGENVQRYREEHGIRGGVATAVIVQRMVDARAAGVAFSADPVSGQRGVGVVSATRGTGEHLVGGAEDGETWRVTRTGDILARPKGERPELTEAEARAVAELAARCEAVFGRPQDIEWAIDGAGILWLLQSRPVTTLHGLPDPDDEYRLWDNSNIAESYGGVTGPLTFTFARRAYENVYREFCRLLRVPGRRVRAADRVFAGMLGRVRGRVYYNLINWYRVLALLPGFSLNRAFMEQMMGVKAPLPEAVVRRIVEENRRGRVADLLALIRTVCGLVLSRARLGRTIKVFRERLERALADPAVPYARQSGSELAQAYHRLEADLLTRWDAPLVNDFIAMIAHGVLRRLSASWLGDADGACANALIRDCGGIVSAEPPRRMREMARRVREVPGLGALLANPDRPVREKLAAVMQDETLANLYRGYLREFGDRCLEELKLESATVEDDPGTLLASIGMLSERAVDARCEEAPRVPEPALRGWRRWVFDRVLDEARNRVRDRENLRFERTRLFGRVRRLLREMGRRLEADGVLDAGDDVFFLELGEVLAAYDGTHAGGSLRELAAVRRREVELDQAAEAPPDRFATWGPLHRNARLESLVPRPAVQGETRAGVGACPGVVRGRVRVVTQPRGARLEPGEVLVARQTDPGWVMLFPCASGLIVERGSLLSHSAIVSRELGLPCVVSVPCVTEWLRDGDEVEMDGGTGRVTRVSNAQ
jgi:pyruvate,water dikinase